MTNFKKKLGIAFTAAILLCCASCIEVNYNIGSGLMPQTHNYDIYTVTVPLEEVYMSVADSLSGYSSTRITIGSIRDDLYGLGTRSCALTLVPLFQDSLVIGDNPEPYYFHFAAAKDTVSYSRANQEWIIQNFNVYELAQPLDPSVDYDCNKPLSHSGTNIAKNSVVYTGGDSLSFNFSDDFAKKFLALDSEVFNDIDTYFENFPGIYIECSDPTGNGGRINMFELQLGYDSDYYYFTGNYARLSYSAEFDGERKDTVLLFYYGVTDFYDVDSLLTNSGTGSFPQYSLNLTSHEKSSSMASKASDKLYVEGGGGLKPRISGKHIKSLTEEAIESYGGDPKTAIINKAKVILPFEFPDDYTEMDIWPDVLAPTCRIIYDTIATFANLSDTSDEYADLGEINRSTLQYSPDITYHVQSLIQIDEDDTSSTQMQRLNDGSYDVWFLIMANEVTETTTSGSSDLSEYYSYLAYQSYYSDMYSYSGYSNYYSNYYTYAMLAALYGSSSTTEVTSLELDKDRYYCATLNGPDYSDEELRPMLQLTFAIPKEEVE